MGRRLHRFTPRCESFTSVHVPHEPMGQLGMVIGPSVLTPIRQYNRSTVDGRLDAPLPASGPFNIRLFPFNLRSLGDREILGSSTGE